MQDCEVACDRMCVMVKGQMVCLGTLQRLKDKFGKGCTIQFVLPHKWTGKPDALTSALVDQFPDAHLTEVQQVRNSGTTYDMLFTYDNFDAIGAKGIASVCCTCSAF
ncbi:hypothetical protein HPB48_010975 [Haemaphysalis longicornis]|uniref:Uncharacterized protein n=1 Tax=Haemaphysalis longicornis TaxID=44386 RepID=A0A9J6GPX3_HAELO|nr:hypothetical protein HPB48_010975 [Haemaphysalis longicornis]